MKFINSELSAKLMTMVLVLGISACANNSNTETDIDDSTDYNANGSEVSTQGYEDGNVSSSTNNSGGSSPLNLDGGVSDAMALKKTEFQFGFDQFSVSAADAQILRMHGKYLAKIPVAAVRVEGHTDEQGTREYNLALGERRSKAVQQILLSAGAKKNQIEVITFGEEKPKVNGSNDAAYTANRRVELKYTSGRP